MALFLSSSYLDVTENKYFRQSKYHVMMVYHDCDVWRINLVDVSQHRYSLKGSTTWGWNVVSFFLV